MHGLRGDLIGKYAGDSVHETSTHRSPCKVCMHDVRSGDPPTDLHGVPAKQGRSCIGPSMTFHCETTLPDDCSNNTMYILVYRPFYHKRCYNLVFTLNICTSGLSANEVVDGIPQHDPCPTMY